MRGGTQRSLVVAARSGDPAALDRLVAEHLPLVYNVVGRALPGHADVVDVVQETMLRCLAGLRDQLGVLIGSAEPDAPGAAPAVPAGARHR